ncbi:MAG: helix-turn-helix domain-containing protein, partial [Candidatus Dormibacteraceae bacterium]
GQVRPLPKHLAEALRRAREEAGLKQKEVAARAQIGQSTLSGIEVGKRSPGRETLNRLRVVLGLSDELYLALLKHASPYQEPLPEQLARLAALPLRWYEMADRKQRSRRDRERGMRPQKGGRFIRNQRLGIRPGRRGGRR